jgi:hypothetical protein
MAKSVGMTSSIGAGWAFCHGENTHGYEGKILRVLRRGQQPPGIGDRDKFNFADFAHRIPLSHQ